MKKMILVALSALTLGTAFAQSAPKQSAPTPAQAQKASAVSANNLAKAQAKTANNMSRYQRTACASKHGSMVKNAKGNLVCQLPKK